MDQNKKMQEQYRQQQMKVLLFQFYDQKWNQVRIAILEVNLQKFIINLKLIKNKELRQIQIPSYLKQHYQPNQQIIYIYLKNITNIEVEETDQKILYLWLGTNPISISFKNQNYANKINIIITQYMRQKQQKTNNTHQSNGINVRDQLSFVIQNIKNGSFQELFAGKSIRFFYRTSYRKLVQIDILYFWQKFYSYFESKNFINFNQRQIFLVYLVLPQMYVLIYKVNPFNDKDFDYIQQYKNITKMQNVLEISDQAIMQAYLDNAKLKFLKDFAACMFIQFDTIKVFQDIICLNNVIILQKIGTSSFLLKEMVKLSKQNPIQYLNIFSQLWEIFKSTSFDLQFKDIKEYFVKEFISNRLDFLALNSMQQILNLQVKPFPRFIQKILQAFTSFLNNDWAYSQSWILSQQQQHSLGNIIIKILSNYQDQSLKSSILLFIRKLIQSNQGKQQPSSRFIQCIFNLTINKLHKYYMKKTNEIQSYIQFMMKLYKFEMIRTRRVLVQNQIILRVCEKKYNKYILICILKMFQTYIQCADKQIIIYLKEHNCFQGLTQEYLRNKYSQNVTNACFLNLLKTIYTYKQRYQNIDIGLAFEEQQKKNAYQ